MDEHSFQKRELLKWALVVSGAALTNAPLLAQDLRLFGIKVPREVLKRLPEKPLDIAMAIAKVLRLESEADRKDLPSSMLERHKGEEIPTTEPLLYQRLMPRLVALIDRSELADVGLADEAGGLLAELHQTQRELPDALIAIQDDDAAAINVPYARIVPGGDGAIALPKIMLPDGTEPIPEPREQESALPLSRAKDYSTLRPEYARLFNSARIRPEYAETADWHLTMMQKSKLRYSSVSKDTDVPWYFIAICHALESSFNFRAHLHNGDFPLSSRTRQVPAGRPTKWLPPSDWESSARDALRLLGFVGQADWTLERTLFRLEAYNGFGYRPYGVASPYLWSFSSHYSRGKYVADRKWSATAKSQQCGAAVMLKLLTDTGEIRWPSS
ncbi:MAG: hypothetical protein WBO17_15915 [Sphingorhabdus sp.]